MKYNGIDLFFHKNSTTKKLNKIVCTRTIIFLKIESIFINEIMKNEINFKNFNEKWMKNLKTFTITLNSAVLILISKQTQINSSLEYRIILYSKIRSYWSFINWKKQISKI